MKNSVGSTLCNSRARIGLVEHYAVPSEDGRLFVKSASQVGVLSGRMVRDVLPKLFPLLDGSRRFEDIAELMSGTLAVEQLARVLDFLSQKGIVREIEEPPADLSSRDLEFYESMARYFGQRGSRYATLSSLRTAHIGIVNTGPIAPALASSLAHFGVPKITVVGTSAIGALEVQQSRYYRSADMNRCRTSVWRERVLAERPHLNLKVADTSVEDVSDWEEMLRDLSMAVILLRGPVLFYPWLDKLNEAAFSLRVPWTTVALLDRDLTQVGPTIRPGVTACYKCFETRLKSNLGPLGNDEMLENYFRQTREKIDFGLLPPVADILAGLAAIEVARTLSPEAVAQTSGKVMNFNAADFTTEYHPVLKLPRCPVCSPVRNKPRPRIWS